MNALRDPQTWVLNFSCPDRAGIVHAVTGGVAAGAGNILELQQFSSQDTGRFFMRVEFESPLSRELLERALTPTVDGFHAEWSLVSTERATRVLVLASKAGHCLNHLLFRQRSGQLNIEIPQILANHPDLGDLAAFYSVPFEHQPVSPETKPAFEARVRQIVEDEQIELVVLARYMQILSPELCDFLAGRAINIHHSFLPGFKGANPYRQAHARGVKVIGATAHFVTSDLDEGPIIEQDTVRVTHAESSAELARRGADVERQVLSRAVLWHAQDRVIRHGNHTIVF